MESNRIIRCTNEDGFFLEFTEAEFGPFLLTEAEGLYESKNTVYVSENSMIDGAVYQGSVAKYRNIVLHVTDTGDYPENRDALNRLFKEKSVGTLVFREANANPRKIDYYVESLDSTGKDPYREHQVSLICPDPFFYDIEGSDESMASWISAFEFPFESTAQGFEFGYQSNELIKTIQNDIAEDNIGVTITITCMGAVVNPSITHIETGDRISIGHSGKPFEISTGDVVVITTATGNKHVTLTHNGVTSEVNHYLTEDSVFVQLMRGSNSFGFNADQGLNNLSISISYTFKYARA
ncbi:MAG: phage tail family protein [Lachnospiraceae bacterium]|nr:phage tail family protein [Lachnospiraceae bacterium]